MPKERVIVFVCTAERCGNDELYRSLCAYRDDIDVRDVGCRGYCDVGQRVDVYDMQGVAMMLGGENVDTSHLKIEALGNDPVRKILGMVRA